jgi:hypothetical protein
VWILNKSPKWHLPRGFLFRSIHSPPFLPVFLSYFILDKIRKLYFDSAHNKTVQHKLYRAFYRIYINNKTTQVTCKVTS